MNIRTLKAIVQLKELNQSEIARAIGTSRQTVSKWFLAKDPIVNIHSKYLSRLAQVLGVSIDVLTKPLPLLENALAEKYEECKVLWDRLYPDVLTFAIAVIREKPQALGRLVQVYGFYKAEKMVGAVIWKKFPSYKKYIHPALRQSLENLWILHQNPMKL